MPSAPTAGTPAITLKRKTFVVTAVFSVLFTIATTLLVFWSVGKQENLAFQNKFSEHARLLAHELDQVLNERISSIDRMGGRWERSKGIPKPLWQADAESYVQSMPGIQAIALVEPDGRIKWISPLKNNNEQALGFNLASDPVRKEALDKARLTHRVAVSGMVDLVQGTQGVLVIRALYVDQHLAGYISAALRLNEVVQKLNLEEKLAGYSISIDYIDDGQRPESKADSTTVKYVPLQLGDGHWKLKIQLRKGIAAVEHSQTSQLVLLAGLSVAALLAGLFMFWIKAVSEQETIEELETRWRFAIEGSDLGLWDWNNLTNKVFFSKRWKEMLGYTDDEIGNTPEEWSNRIHPDDRDSTYAELEKHFNGETTLYRSDLRMLCKDGSYRWIHARGRVMEWDKHHKPARMLGTHTDIHERKVLEGSLQAERQNLRSILDNAPIGIWRQDNVGHLQFVNRWFCESVGIPEERFLAVPHYAELYDEEMAKRYIASDMAAIASDLPQFPDETITFTDGKAHDLEITKIRLADENGDAGLIGIAWDISERKKLDQTLRIQEDRLRQILQNQSVATFIIDNQHRVMHWNSACEILTGLPAGEVIGTRNAWRGFYPEERPCLADLVLESRQSEATNLYPIQAPSALLDTGWHAEAWFENLGGKRRYVIFDASPIIDAAGNISAVVETLQDITNQKNIEESLRETEDRFRVIADSAPVLIWMSDTEGLCTFFNKPWLDFTGRPLEQQLGNGWIESIHPEDREQCLDLYHQRLKSRMEFTMEYRLLRHDGEYRWVTDHGIPRAQADGTFVGYIGSCVDIEEAKRTEHQLRTGREMAKRALEALQYQKYALDQHAIVATTDVEGRITYANEKFCQISGYATEELLGQDHKIVHSGYHPHGFFKEMYRTIARGEVWQGEVCNRAKDGSLYWVYTTVVPFMGADGKPEQYIAIRADISERKAAETELKQHRDHLQELVLEQTHDLRLAKEAAEQANLAKSEFLANMSHELRTPLHAILSFSELGHNKIESAPADKLRGYFDRINASGNRLLALLNDLLDLSKLEAGKMALQKGDHDLIGLLMEATSEFEALINAAKIELRLMPTTCNTTVEVDPLRIGQVLRNLLSNAIKFTPPGGKITIQISPATLHHGRRAEDRGTIPAVQVEISDTGVGIPENELQRIFDKFVQSSKTNSGAGGTGLGLAICKEIVDMHHGLLLARNNIEGGATFCLTLPITSHPELEA
jgi:PAS domain S-box-containing protein